MQVNERRCGAKPVYGQEVLEFLTFLSGPCISPAPLSPEGNWGRSGHSCCLFAQNNDNYWSKSRAVRGAIYSIEGRIEQLSDIIDRYTYKNQRELLHPKTKRKT